MINRNLSNNELLSYIHGLYTDYYLLKNHTFSMVNKYLRETFGEKDGEGFFPEQLVRVVEFEYKDNVRCPSFSIVLESSILLDFKELYLFEKEFEVKLTQKSIIYDGGLEHFNYNYKYNEKLEERTRIRYYFKRKREVEFL